MQRGDVGEPAGRVHDSGSQQRRLCIAASRATTAAAAPPRGPLRPRSHRTTDRSATKGTDPVDAELGELLHDPLGPLALHQGERHRDRRDRPAGPRRSDRRAPAAAPNRAGRHAPAPSDSVERVAGAEPQHPGEVVLVVGARARAGRGRRRRRAGPPRPVGPAIYRKAERILPRNPVSAGATSSPRSAASWRSRSSSAASRLGGVSTTTCTSRSPRPRPCTWGTPRPRRRNTRPVWVPRGTTRSSAPSSVS